ncbi:MAG: 30S ribosomal protein S25e [Thermoprotei archaeon]|nr:MAG: 30S ribosomal protein S25e [Thermoprotei archaeon]RLE98915.1 MAG: 30S ribosomal protein S25e [Thermoprotei archaeon]HDI74596.1 30S ribosomal protein S25e [Thermoprotei archaeon]
MGGKKKPTLSQLEKRLGKLREESAKKSKKKKRTKATTTAITLPKIIPLVNPDLIKLAESEVRKMKCITPYSLATKLNIKISLAKAILKTLSSEGIIVPVNLNHRVPIYTPKNLAQPK